MGVTFNLYFYFCILEPYLILLTFVSETPPAIVELTILSQHLICFEFIGFYASNSFILFLLTVLGVTLDSSKGLFYAFCSTSVYKFCFHSAVSKTNGNHEATFLFKTIISDVCSWAKLDPPSQHLRAIARFIWRGATLAFSCKIRFGLAGHQVFAADWFSLK